MRHIIIVIAFSICACVFISSCSRNADDARLISADSLINEHPDSAFSILRSIKSDSLSGSANSAFYALLYTQAQYRNYDSIKSDSLIDIAINYYSDNHDREKYTRSLIFKGAALSDMGDPAEAMNYFKQAEANADTSDFMNLGYVNMQMANLYMNAYAGNNIDIKKYKKALYYYTKKGSSKYKLLCISNIGGLYRFNKIDSAYYYLNKAIKMAKSIGDSAQYYSNIAMLARAFYVDSIYIKGKETAIFAIKNGDEYLYDDNCFFDAARCCAKLGMVDSALYYYSKAENRSHNGIAAHRISQLITLADIEIAKGNHKKAIYYMKQSDSISRIIDNNSISDNLVNLEKKYDKTRIELEKSEIQKTNLLYAFIILLLLFGLFSLFVFLRNKRRKLEEAELLIEQIKTQSNEKENNLIAKLNQISTRVKNTDDKFNRHIEIIRNLMQDSYLYENKPEIFMRNFKKAISVDRFSDGIWKDLTLFVNENYNNIIDSLILKHPNLTSNDINFIVLLCCGFSNVEIMICMNYTNERSAYNRRLILAKKMNLDESLDLFLKKQMDKQQE